MFPFVTVLFLVTCLRTRTASPHAHDPLLVCSIAPSSSLDIVDTWTQLHKVILLTLVVGYLRCFELMLYLHTHTIQLIASRFVLRDIRLLYSLLPSLLFSRTVPSSIHRTILLAHLHNFP